MGFVSAAIIILSLFIGIFLHNQLWLLYPLLFVLMFISGMLRKISIGMAMRSLIFTICIIAAAERASSIEVGLSLAAVGSIGAIITALCQFIPPYEPRFAYQRKNIAALYTALASDAHAIAEGKTKSSSYILSAYTARNALALLPENERTDVNFLFALVAKGERIGGYLHSTETKIGDELHQKQLKKVRELLTTISTEILTGRSINPIFKQEVKDMLIFLRGEQSKEDISLQDEFNTLWVQSETLASNWKKIKSELHWHSPIFRHALRLAVTVTLAEFLGSIFGSWGNLGVPNHGFWLSLTTGIVLFPDYGETFSRGIGRTAGTLVGAFAGYAISLLPTNQIGHTIILVLLLFGYLTFRSAGQPWLIMWVVAWVCNLGGGGSAVAFTRSIDTIIGAGIALIAYQIWPTWNTDQIHQRLSEWILLEGQHINMVTTAWANAACSDPAKLDCVRHEARVAHQRLEQTIAHAQHEPVFTRSKWNESELSELRRAVHEVALQVSVLTALSHDKVASDQPFIVSYGENLQTYMNLLADTMIKGTLTETEYDYAVQNLKVYMDINNTDTNPRVRSVFNRLVLNIKKLTLTAKVLQ